MTDARVLVVGAQPRSLGHEISLALQPRAAVWEAGVAGEHLFLNATDADNIDKILRVVDPTYVVCTVGVNVGRPIYDETFMDVANIHMATNYLAPMKLLSRFAKYLDGMPGTFVAISSNSAHIARSNSAAYCASKAALSMGLRCAARDAARASLPLHVWGYEPGALANTPMTQLVAGVLPEGVPMSRMLGGETLPTHVLARKIANDLLHNGRMLNGSMIRIDNGEQ